MDFFTATSALNRLIEFQESYIKYALSRSRRNLNESNAELQHLSYLSFAVQKDLNRINRGFVTLIEPLGIGGRQHPTEIIALVINPSLAEQYEVDPREIVNILTAAIGEYQRQAKIGFFSLFNPLWWVRQAISVAIRIPFYVLGFSGFNQVAAESSTIGTAYKRTALLAVWVGVFLFVLRFILFSLGVLADLEQMSWLEMIRRWLTESGIALPARTS